MTQIRARRSHRPSNHISLPQLDSVWPAFGHAARIGLIPSDTLDIHFDRGGLHDPANNGRACLLAFLKLMRQWVERRGYKTCYIWVLESMGDAAGYGLHAHVILHVPDELRERFHQLKRKWARKAGLNVGIRGVMNWDRLSTPEQAKGKLRYMCKDRDPSLAELFGSSLDDRNKASDQPVYGQRMGMSRNLGPSARANYSPPANDDQQDTPAGNAA